jgi:two-component system chemotaxis response regulator CheB
MIKTNRVIVVGASTGGIEAMQELAGALPANFPAPVLVVIHIGAGSPNVLDRILSRTSKLPASYPRNGEGMKPGHLYLAPADHHLVLGDDHRLHVTRGPKENRVRPAIDPLFRSAAAAYGRHAVGVVLTGYLDDGTAGLWAIRERGGVAIVQNPEEAVAPSMPMSALKHVEVNHCLALDKIPALLVKLAHTPVAPNGVQPVPSKMQTEIRIAREDDPRKSGIYGWGEPSLFACPECHGVLLKFKEGSNLRFRCHTGHAYSIETLLAELSGKTEEVLWNAARGINETVTLLEQMAAELEKHGHREAATQFRRQAAETARRAEAVRRLLVTEDPARRKLS